jgi:hypothetical protein
MKEFYGFWQRGIKPSDFIPDKGQCTKQEIERWEKDLKQERNGKNDFLGFYGIGIYK